MKNPHLVTPTGAFTAWASLLVSIVGVGATMVLMFAYVRQVDRAAERRNVERQRQICGIIVLIDDRNQAMPPAADAETNRFRAELHTYRLHLGC